MGKLKKTSPGTYSTTGTKPSDWGVDPLKPYSSPSGDSYKFDPKQGLKKASRKQRNTKNIDPFNNKGRNA